MAKIGIYIPDERMKDIERWRDRLNFSRLFLDAFDRAITSNADLDKIKGKEMKAVVERLKREADATFEGGWKTGAKWGREWAMKHAHVSHLRRIGEGELTFDGVEADVKPFLYHHYQPQGYYKTPDDEYAQWELDQYDDSETARRGFNQGFIEAAKLVWLEVKAAF